jgi:hypothetical protein
MIQVSTNLRSKIRHLEMGKVCKKERFAERKNVESPLMMLLIKTIEYEIRKISPKNRCNKNCTMITVKS